jgi:hypothetical protein
MLFIGDFAMTAVYDKFGVRFLYPENWQITDEEYGEWPHSIAVQSPGSGFWSLHVYLSTVDPAEVAAEVLQTMQEEYSELEAMPVTERIGVADAVGYDMDFCCLDFIITSRTRSFRVGNWTFLMLCQAENREFEQLEDLFSAMTLSLLNDKNGVSF